MESRPPTLSELAGNREEVPAPIKIAPSKMKESVKVEKLFEGGVAGFRKWKKGGGHLSALPPPPQTMGKAFTLVSLSWPTE